MGNDVTQESQQVSPEPLAENCGETPMVETRLNQSSATSAVTVRVCGVRFRCEVNINPSSPN